MNTSRLLKLADYLDVLPEKQFDFSRVSDSTGEDESKDYSCGSVGCAVGHTPYIWPELVKFNGLNLSLLNNSYEETFVNYLNVAMFLFDLDLDDSMFLFSPPGKKEGDGRLSSNATPKQVSDRIRQFIEQRKKNDSRFN